MAFVVNVHYGRQTVPLEIHPDWQVGVLKNQLSERLRVSPEEVRIIFQGRELENDYVIQDCDLGAESSLHAVRGRKVSVEADGGGPSSMDLPSIQSAPDSLPPSSIQLQDPYRCQFYVYCKTCKGIVPGKLRVRCFTCKQGTLTVERDPSCWEDVLRACMIYGVCQADICPGNIAEFYFKCSMQHLGSEDTAPALYLVKSNSRQVPCLICTEVSNPVLVFPCEEEDGHAICLDCFKGYCENCLNERAFISTEEHGYTLGCPAGCEQSLITEVHHFHILGDEQYERYKRFAVEEHVLRSGGLLCPAPGCGQGLMVDETVRKVVCIEGCGFTFCRNCLESYHEGECSPHQVETAAASNAIRVHPQNAEQARWESASRETIQQITKRCPKCKTPTERDGGCMHMTCRCKFEWCWLCGVEWSRSCQGDHWFG